VLGIASLALASSPAFADPKRGADASEEHGRHHGGGNGAPEIDPSLAAAGIVLLIGGTLVLTSRRRPATS
jgi:LPXTG-motif cell wall-anchored protein